jgi:hypothetical protein
MKQNRWTAPFSAKGELDTPTLLIYTILFGAISYFATTYFKTEVVSAMVSRNEAHRQILYAAWFLTSSICFWIITNAFFKRWCGIEGELLGARARGFIRLFLLSPLLSIWFVILSLMYSSGGLFDPKSSRFKKFVTGLVTLAIFHLCFLGYSVARKELKLTKSFAFVPVSGPQEFLLIEGWTPSRGLYVHIFPYFSPLSKLAFSFYTDYRRSEAILQEAKSGIGCPVRTDIPGVDIKDCFFSLYRKHDEEHSFASPIFGLIQESRYQESQKSTPKPESLEPFARSVATVSNLLWFLQPGVAEKGRQLASHPSGLLPYLSSPELTVIDIGSDLQRQVLVAKVLPMLRDPIQKMEKLEPTLLANTTPEQGARISKIIRRLRDEAKEIEAQ